MDDVITLVLVAVSLLSGFIAGYKVRDHDYKHLLENYHTLIDRDPKTGRFVKSMRKLKNDN